MSREHMKDDPGLYENASDFGGVSSSKYSGMGNETDQIAATPGAVKAKQLADKAAFEDAVRNGKPMMMGGC